MADVRLKDPRTDYEVVVGSAIEAANLRAAGYTDVDEPKPSGGELTPPTDSTDATSNTGEAGGETPPDATEQTTETTKSATRRR
jgi:hypothetical protein